MDPFFWIWPVRTAAPCNQPFSGSIRAAPCNRSPVEPSENLGRKSDGGGTVNRKLVPALVGILRCSAKMLFCLGRCFIWIHGEIDGYIVVKLLIVVIGCFSQRVFFLQKRLFVIGGQNPHCHIV